MTYIDFSRFKACFGAGKVEFINVSANAAAEKTKSTSTAVTIDVLKLFM